MLICCPVFRIPPETLKFPVEEFPAWEPLFPSLKPGHLLTELVTVQQRTAAE